MQARDLVCYLARMQRPWDKARFLELLTQIMERTSSSWEDLARLSGINSATFSRWRSSKSQPNFDTLRELALWIRRDHPELENLAPELIRAAGFGSVKLDDVAPADPGQVPALIRQLWPDQAERLWSYSHVRTIWQTPRLPEDAKVALTHSFAATLENSENNGGKVRRLA